MSLHVRDRSPERIGAIVGFLQRQKWVGVLFTAGLVADGAGFSGFTYSDTSGDFPTAPQVSAAGVTFSRLATLFRNAS